MLADRVRQTSGGGLPQGARHLMHFENNVYDSIQKAYATTDYGEMTFSTDSNNKKFGNYGARTNTATRLAFPNSIIDWGNQDFTVSGWLRSTYPENSSIDLINVFAYDNSNKQSWRLYKVSRKPHAIRVTFDVYTESTTYSVTSSPDYPLVYYSMLFIKFGRKNGALFLIVNGVKYTNGNPNIGTTPLQTNTTEPIRIGGTGGTEYAGAHDAFYDEWLVQLGVGDDSLEIPTQPWG